MTVPIIAKAQKISQARLLKTIGLYLPNLVAKSFANRERVDRINTEMLVLLSRAEPDRILIKLREETAISVHDCAPEESIEDRLLRSAFNADKVETYVNNATVKIDNELVLPMLETFYSSRKLGTLDALVRFRSGVIGSITIKHEIGGY